MLTVGQTAPDFSLAASTDSQISLADYKGQKLVIYFYPKDKTPGCTSEALDFCSHKADFDALGVAILGVSKDSIASHKSFIEKYALSFPLLSDPDLLTSKDYFAWGEKKMFGKTALGVTRCTYVIDEAGQIAATYPKVRVKGHVAAVLADLKAL